MKTIYLLVLSVSVVALAACTTGSSGDSMSRAAASDDAPFAGPGSVSYAGELWNALVAANMAGDGAVASKPYPGQHPHGAILDTIEGRVTVGGHNGAVIVKRNYGGEGASVESVGNDPVAHLKAVTVMFKREAGYDPEDKDWFWAKYLPSGNLDKNPKGMALAGRVAKGKPMGCIACHTAAPGGDFVFNNDRYVAGR